MSLPSLPSLPSSSPIIILIITCNNVEYEKRRQNQKCTIDIIKATPGFEVYYLIGIESNIDNITENIIIQENFSNGCSAIVVPIIECYENLSLKVMAGFTFFLNREIKGILKFDDDTNITSPIVLEFINYSHSMSIDYLGHTPTKINSEYSTYHLNKNMKHTYLYSMIEKNNLQSIYFSGFFYYISYRMLIHIRMNRLNNISEDISICNNFTSLLNGKSLIIPDEIKKYIKPQVLNGNLNKRPLVMSILKGGLSNRIFQVLASISYANLYNCECVLNTDINLECDDHPPFDKIIWMLSKIFPSLKIVNIPIINKTKKIIINSPNIKLITQPPDGFTFINLPSFNTITTTENNSNLIIVLDGFFQCYKYFDNINLLKYLKLDYQISKNVINELYGNRTNMYFLHIRLGDYLKFIYHYVPLELYYERCITKILENTQSTQSLIKILVMSNSKNNEKTFNRIMDKLPKSNRITYEIQNPEDMPDKTLFLMSLCSGGAICANSSLSWLGAFLIKEKYEQDLKILNSLNSSNSYNNLIKLEKPTLFMPSQWMQYSSKYKRENVVNIYPPWAEIIDI